MLRSYRQSPARKPTNNGCLLEFTCEVEGRHAAYSPVRCNTKDNEELDSTLLSYTADESNSICGTVSFSSSGADDQTNDVEPGQRLTQIGNYLSSMPKDESLWAHPALDSSPMKVLVNALGLNTADMGFFPFEENADVFSCKVARSPQQLSAKVKVLVRKVLACLSAREFSHSAERENEHQALVLRLLQLYGFHIRPAKLRPTLSTFASFEKHEFWILIPPAHLVHPAYRYSLPAEWALVLDFQFLDLFQLARPAESYSSLMKTLPTEFIGSVTSDLPDAIEYLSNLATQSFEIQGMSLPPWRQSAFLQCCFSRGIEEATRERRLLVLQETSDAMAHDLLMQHDWFFQTFGFRAMAETEVDQSSHQSYIEENNGLLEFEKYPVDQTALYSLENLKISSNLSAILPH